MHPRSFISFLIAFILSSSSYAGVQVAFFEKRTKDGQLAPIEPGGHLYHVAIQIEDRWLESHPFYGVREVADLRQIGDLYSIVELDREVAIEKYRAEFGKPYSLADSWDSTKSTYCSKLVAQVLDIKPLQMKSREGWGISPDGLYRVLKRAPHREALSCSKVF